MTTTEAKNDEILVAKTLEAFDPSVQTLDATATTLPFDNIEDIEGGEKQGSICCGCCFDYRRAVIVLAIFGIIDGITNVNLTLAAESSFDDPRVYWTGLGLAMAFTFFYVLQLHAALSYNVTLLCITVCGTTLGVAPGMWMTYRFVHGIEDEPLLEASVNAIYFGISLLACFLDISATVGLIVEIEKGIMSRENYPRESYSCCQRFWQHSPV